MAFRNEISQRLYEMRQQMVDLMDANIKVLSEVRDSLHDMRNRSLELAGHTDI